VIKLPSGIELQNLIDNLRILSWEASEKLTYYAQIVKDSNGKRNILRNDNFEDPVTLADISVNEIVINKINQLYKDVNWKILSEENVKSGPYNPNINQDWVWILDPLDGTKDFIQGTTNYAMHLALNYKKRPLIGIVLIPERDELWFAVGCELWCENRNGVRIKPKPLKRKSLQEMSLVTSKNHGNTTLNKLIKKINFKEVIIMGSIGCKIASIVRRDSDIYICLSLPGMSSPKDWDFAAPEAILKASGGNITTLDNKDLIYGKSNFEQGGIIVASNNINNHKNICSEIEEIIREGDLFPL
jgi:3'(2'), 5'-bisphosphate nucleotidase